MSWGLWEPCEYLGHSNILWNYLEVNYVFWIKGNLWALYVLPMCYDMWLPGDWYLSTRLCDGYWVLSLWWWWVLSSWWHISSIFVTAMSSVFVTAYLAPTVCRRWVSSLWRQISSIFVMALSCGLRFGIVLLLLTNYSM